MESEAESDSESADENETISELTEEVAFVDFQAILPKHLTCIDHSLELVLNRVIDKTFKASAIGIVILKARKLISRVIFKIILLLLINSYRFENQFNKRKQFTMKRVMCLTEFSNL